MSATADGVQAERRQLTIMFCDMVGSTALSARLDPEDLVDILNLFLDACNDPIQDYGGYVGNFLGDGLLVYFGYPRSRENDAERAVRAALGILAKLPAVNRQINPAGIEIKVRIGIATGQVIVGDAIGKGYTERAAVVGETPNLAARLQEFAEPDTILVDDVTRRLLGGRLALTALGVRPLKGISVPPSIWLVTGDRIGEQRPKTRERQRLDLVGRKAELAALDACWQRVLDGSGQTIAITGDAGIGKSHLLQAWIGRLDDQDGHLLLACQCSPYHENSALHPFMQPLEAACQIAAGEEDEIKSNKIVAWSKHQGAGDAAAGLLKHILGIADNDQASIAQDGETASPLPVMVADLLIVLCRHRPVIVSIEDIHWIDPTSFEALVETARRCSQGRLMIVATCRSSQDPIWPPDAMIEPLWLDRLDRQDGLALVQKTAAERHLPSDITDEILAKSDGMPLFLAELTKAVVETSGPTISATGPSQVPATLQAALSARLDRLGDAKQIVQTAAVLGYGFSRQLLAAMTGRTSEDLTSILDRLVDAELLRSGSDSDEHYGFRNALIRDVAYQTLLRRQRQALHQRAGDLIEKNFPALASAEPEMLARHFTDAGLEERAADYWELAGQRALARFATEEAKVLLAKTLHAKLPEAPAADEQEMLLQSDLSASEMAMKGFDYAASAEAFVQAHLRRAGHDDPLALARSLRTMVWFLCRQRELHRARDVALRLLDLAKQQEDHGFLAAAHVASGASFLFLGNLAEAETQFNHCASHYDPEDHQALAEHYGMDPGINCMSFSAICLWLLGFPDKSRMMLEASLGKIDSLSHDFTIAVVQSWAAWTLTMFGDEQAAFEQAAATETYARERDNVLSEAEGLMARGWAMVALGQPDGLGLFERGFEQKRKTGSELLFTFYHGRLADMHHRLGNHDAALDAAIKGLDAAEQTGERWWQPELLRLKGVLLSETEGDSALAEKCLKEALETARRTGSLSLELRAAMSLVDVGRPQTNQKKITASLATLQQIYNRFSEGFDTPDLMRAEQMLSQEVDAQAV